MADLFGIGGDDDDNNNDDDIEAYIIVQLTPAAGWRAVFTDPTSTGGHRTLGLACFALVEMIPRNPEVAQIPQRVIRPFVADEYGQLDDVEAYDDFVCLVAPGLEIQPVVEFAVRNRQT